jgi:hypothetical protein
LSELQSRLAEFDAGGKSPAKPKAATEVKPEQSAAPQSAPAEAKPILIETPDGTKQVSIVNVENGSVTFKAKGSKKEITWPEDRFRALARGADLETTKAQVQQAIDDFNASKATADTSMSARIEEAKKPGVEPEVDKGAPASLKPTEQKWEAKTPDRSMTASGHYAVVELDDLVTSHDPFRRVVNDNFPQQYQPRDRAAVKYASQEQKIASTLVPDDLMNGLSSSINEYLISTTSYSIICSSTSCLDKSRSSHSAKTLSRCITNKSNKGNLTTKEESKRNSRINMTTADISKYRNKNSNRQTK